MIDERLSHLIGLVEINTKENESNISLYSGLSGLSLYYLELWELTNNVHYKRRALSIYDRIFERLNSTEVELHDMYSFSGGLSGVFYSIGSAVSRGYLSADVLSDSNDVEDYLFNGCIDLLKNQLPDPLHGAMGILYYFSTKKTNPERIKYMDLIMLEYTKHLKCDSHGARMLNKLLTDQQNEEYNLSLSHGMAGHLAVFHNLITSGYQGINYDLIIGQLNYIRSQRLETDGIRTSNYPGIVVESMDQDGYEWQKNYNVRLGWCYGDLNQSMIFIKYSKILDDPKLFKEGLDLGLSTLVKSSLHDTHIKDADPFFCHGTIGLAYFYFKLYGWTGNMLFKVACDHWVIKTYEVLEKRGDAYKQGEYYALLEGVPAVALMLLAIEKGHDVSFDNIFLI